MSESFESRKERGDRKERNVQSTESRKSVDQSVDRSEVLSSEDLHGDVAVKKEDNEGRVDVSERFEQEKNRTRTSENILT